MGFATSAGRREQIATARDTIGPWAAVVAFLIGGWGVSHWIVGELWRDWRGPIWPLHVAITSTASALYGLTVADIRGTILTSVGATFASLGLVLLFIFGVQRPDAAAIAWPLVLPMTTGFALMAWGLRFGVAAIVAIGARSLISGLILFGLSLIVYLAARVLGFDARFDDGSLITWTMLAGGALLLVVLVTRR